MGKEAVVRLWAFLFMFNVGAGLCGVEVAESFSIFGVVIIGAVFVVVIAWDVAGLYFEVV